MKTYSSKISLVRNGRGVYCIDTVMGCRSGMSETEGGCYGDCYAAKAARRYGIDFSASITRHFQDHNHKDEICNKIARAKMPFVRIGCSGDPSEDWEHTLSILKIIAQCNKEIVIITRHWNPIAEEAFAELGKMNLCVNTSVSAMDPPERMAHSLRQHARFKAHCKSVLRVVSCNFNESTEEGRRMSAVQAELLESPGAIDTVFRPSPSNRLLLGGYIIAKSELFNGKKCLASKHSARVYMGRCSTCVEMCGVNSVTGVSYAGRPGVLIQAKLFQANKRQTL